MAEQKEYTISDLTEKQQTLLRLLLEGKSKAEAYREAYPGAKISNPSDQVNKMINNEGGKFLKFSVVYERARAQTIKRAEEALEESIRRRTELLALLSAIGRGEKTETILRSVGDGIQSPIEMPAGMHDRIKALELLGKNLGLFKEKLDVEVDAPNPFATLTTEELRQLIAAGDAK